MNKSLFTLILIATLSSFSFQAQAADSILSTLIPSQKKCNYVTNKKYEPFSNINKDFPGATTLKMDGNGCIDVAGGTENLLKLLFTTAITIIIVMTVISISIAGIQFMTEQATGQIKGGAKKRLQNSFIALALGLLSYTILYTVNKQLVNFTFNPVSIDINGAINRGIQDANIAEISSGASTALVDAVQTPYAPGSQISPTGYINIQTGAPCTPVAGVPDSLNPCVKQTVPTPTFGETTTPGNFSTYASFGSIRCSGALCSSSNPTVFGYLDGDGTVGMNGDNGIGNALWSSKPGCTADTGNTVTMGLALPQGFWRAAGIAVAEVKNIGIKVYINGVAQRIMPIVDDSQLNLDFTFAAARAYLDPTITNSNRINTAGKNVTFEIIKNYYLTNQKTDLIYTSNRSTFSNKIPCTI